MSEELSFEWCFLLQPPLSGSSVVRTDWANHSFIWPLSKRL